MTFGVETLLRLGLITLAPACVTPCDLILTALGSVRAEVKESVVIDNSMYPGGMKACGCPSMVVHSAASH